MEPMRCIHKIGLLVRFKDGTNVLLKTGLFVRFKDGTNALYTSDRIVG